MPMTRPCSGLVMKCAAFAAVLAASLATTSPCDAQEVAPDDDAAPFRLAITGGTEFPMGVGVAARAELPYRIRASLGVSVLPGPYVSAINGFLVEIAAYDQETADLIESALEASLVTRLHVGHRPFADHGFYTDAGYRIVALGGSAETSEIIAGTTGVTVPEGQGGKPCDITSTLHLVDIEFGWELEPIRHLIIVPSIGGAFTFAASTSIEPDFDSRAARLVDAFATGSENYLDDLYTSYVFTPVVGLAVGYEL